MPRRMDWSAVAQEVLREVRCNVLYVLCRMLECLLELMGLWNYGGLYTVWVNLWVLAPAFTGSLACI